jgi:hypothetical protein
MAELEKLSGKDIWKANTIDDIDVDNMTDGHLVGIIGMFEKWDRSPPILAELKLLAKKRGIDLDHKYDKENRDKRKKEQGDVPARLAVLYDTDPQDKTLTERVITTGRTTLYDLFTKSNILTDNKLNHHPFIVFRDDGDSMNVVIIFNARELFSFSDETKVMVQWKGKWNSDFFHFTIKDLKDFLNKGDVTIDVLIERKIMADAEKKRLKEARQEAKLRGPTLMDNF